VPYGSAIIFRHGEDSSYGVDEDCELPYVFNWIEIQETAAIKTWTDQIRHAFGSIVQLDAKGEAGQIIQQRVRELASGRERERLFLAELTCRLILSIYREQITAQQKETPWHTDITSSATTSVPPAI